MDFINFTNLPEWGGLTVENCVSWCSGQILDHAYNERWAIVAAFVFFVVRRFVQHIKHYDTMQNYQQRIAIVISVCEFMTFVSLALYLILVGMILRGIG